jgi:hypothetical protein
MAAPFKGLIYYARVAFHWHWNLLAVAAGVALAFLIAVTGVGVGAAFDVLALLAAAELTYLGLASSSSSFQRAVDERDRSARLGGVAPIQTDQLERLRAQLPPELWKRFEMLRDRCIHLGELAREFQGSDDSTASSSSMASDMHGDSLDRLLWMFLRMLASRNALDRFLTGTSRDGFVRDIADTQKTIDGAKAAGRGDKLLAALDDKLKTLQDRLANLDKARDNRDLISAEIDRIEQKVSAVGEMALSAHDASDLSSQVDGIAAGVSATEDALRDLPVIPDFSMEQPPAILRQAPPPVPTRQ